MAELPHDIILEIMKRLPLKHAVGCCILNKYLYNHISTPQFARDHALLSSSPISDPIIFHCSANHTKFTVINSPVPKPITLPNEVMILDSCNGVLLLQCGWSANYYVFNPFTGGVMFLNYDIKSRNCVGLAVDIPANPSSSSSYDFKLVAVDTRTTSFGQTRLRFRVFVPSRRGELVMKNSVDLYHGGSFTPSTERPVYAHGCLHWVGNDGVAIAAFDVASGRARIMGGPLTKAEEDCDYFHSWFGLAQYSLQFVHTTREEVIVYSHNYVTQEWRVVCKIPNASFPTSDGVRMFCDAKPVFFDGGNVFFHIRREEKGEIYVHDLSVGKWKKRGEVGEESYQNYIEFVPTTARVSDVCMSAKRRSTQKGLCLLGLQQLLMDHESINMELDFDGAKSKTQKDIKLTSIRETIENYIRTRVNST